MRGALKLEIGKIDFLFSTPGPRIGGGGFNRLRAIRSHFGSSVIFWIKLRQSVARDFQNLTAPSAVAHAGAQLWQQPTRKRRLGHTRKAQREQLTAKAAATYQLSIVGSVHTRFMTGITCMGGSEFCVVHDNCLFCMARKTHRSYGPAAAALGRGSEISLCSENRLCVGYISGAQRQTPKSLKVWIFFVQAGISLGQIWKKTTLALVFVKQRLHWKCCRWPIERFECMRPVARPTR